MSHGSREFKLDRINQKDSKFDQRDQKKYQTSGDFLEEIFDHQNQLQTENNELKDENTELKNEIDMIKEQIEKLKIQLKEQEELINDLLVWHDCLEEMKAEYLRDEDNNPAFKSQSGTKIWAQFQGLSENVKAIIVTMICGIFNALGTWASWGFIVWAWPKLFAFATTIAKASATLARWLPFLIKIAQSESFQKFLEAWQAGDSLDICLQQVLNTPLWSSILKMVPKVFTAFKMPTSII